MVLWAQASMLSAVLVGDTRLAGYLATQVRMAMERAPAATSRQLVDGLVPVLERGAAAAVP
jgi:hypothetical protein